VQKRTIYSIGQEDGSESKRKAIMSKRSWARVGTKGKAMRKKVKNKGGLQSGS
jgi:hypothetical protein